MENNHLRLLDVDTTFIKYEDQEHSVYAMLPALFDQWIRQYVEKIENVDIAIWSIFHRWHIINSVLDAGLLEFDDETGRRFLLPPESAVEEKSSDNEQEVSESAVEDCTVL